MIIQPKMAFFQASTGQRMDMLGTLTKTVLMVSLVGFHAFAAEGEVVERQIPWTASRLMGRPEPPLPYQPVVAFPHLQFNAITTLTNAPNSGRLFVVQLSGEIVSFEDTPTSRDVDVFLDVRQVDPQVTHVYGMTFHPDFPRQPYVYLCYVRRGNEPDGSVISRFRVTETAPPRADPTSEHQILRWLAGGHNGCALKFGPDNLLYISTGDGTGPNPPDTRLAGQDVSNLLSAILRIDVDHPSDGRNYAIPKDNPFVDLPGARPEIFAFGFRNPWKMSFDRATGDLWVGDVGWDMWELVYRVERGGNYGWSIKEGSNPILPNQEPGPGPILPPIVQHHHSEARSITGGFVYHGKRLPDLRGAYVYGDYNTGKIWSLRYDGKRVTEQRELAETRHQIVGWAEMQSGELYYADHQRSNRIYRLEPSDVPDDSRQFPRRLSHTGLFDSVEQLSPARGVIRYEVNAELWEDGARAIRHLALPGSSRINNQKENAWVFPANSVVARTILKTVAGIERRIETQILHRDDNEWRPYSYVWNSDQNDATLAPAAGQQLVLEDGTNYRIHSRVECQLCHTKPMGVLLGVNAPQLRASALRTGGQLQRWRQLGLFEDRVPSGSATTRPLVDPYELTAELNERARSYLHVNCVSCHRPGGGGPSPIHLDYQRTLAETKLLDAAPVQGDLGIPTARIIKPGHPHDSVLFYRMAKVGAGHMPHLGAQLPDEAGLQLMHDWIRWLTPDLPADSDAETLREQMASPRGALALAWQLRGMKGNVEQRQRLIDLALASPHSHVRDLFEPFYPADKRKRRLGTQFDYSVVLQRQGDVDRGRQVFLNKQNQCTSCHRIGESGGNLGPDVNQLAKKYRQREKLLDAIVRPSVEMDPKYTAHRVLTSDGEVLLGILVDEGRDEMEIRTIDNKSRRIPFDKIVEMQASDQSLMPEFLLQAASAQEVADLLAFLLDQAERP